MWIIDEPADLILIPDEGAVKLFEACVKHIYKDLTTQISFKYTENSMVAHVEIAGEDTETVIARKTDPISGPLNL